MSKEEKIKEIYKRNIDSITFPVYITIADAVAEGYQLGWSECMKHFNIKCFFFIT